MTSFRIVSFLWRTLVLCFILCGSDAFVVVGKQKQIVKRNINVGYNSGRRSISQSSNFNRVGQERLKSELNAKANSKLLSERWLPRINHLIPDDDIFAIDEYLEDLERQSLSYASSLINSWIDHIHPPSPPKTNVDGRTEEEAGESAEPPVAWQFHANDEIETRGQQLAKGRFIDLTETLQGQQTLELLFSRRSEDGQHEEDHVTDHVVEGAIIAIQSLLIMGMQVGVKGTPKFQAQTRSHLKPKKYNHQSALEEEYQHSLLPTNWDLHKVRILKHQCDFTAATQLLATLKQKRTAQGAFDILFQMGVWQKHENLPLLRSGFPLAFTDLQHKHITSDTNVIDEQYKNLRDPDSILGIRQDLTHLKVYTIDSASTFEIDDGLSFETIIQPDGTTKERIWIHIADADHYAPRGSDIFNAAKIRATSLYLPAGSVSMFPSHIGSQLMSLTTDKPFSYALSLGLELNDDGSIDLSSLIVTPSKVKVSYRLTYAEVDEMLDMGVGYFEERELGALLGASNKRRKFRIANGSSESFIPNPIPQGTATTKYDTNAKDNISIDVMVQVSHNSGLNQTTSTSSSAKEESYGTNKYASPVSSAFLIVTEMMIMSGEALGRWRQYQHNDKNDSGLLPNRLQLPYRGQEHPDFTSRYDEKKTMDLLGEGNAGGGYCQAWYGRRFFKRVRVDEQPKPHFGLGLEYYVQWSSPIRRFCDLQAHAAVKRFLRRKEINQLVNLGQPIPKELHPIDIGCALPIQLDENESDDKNNEIIQYTLSEDKSFDTINYNDGQAFANAARFVQTPSNQYWLFEYLKRKVESNPDEVAFECVVLGCVNPDRLQYAIYVYEIGLEHKYISQMGSLKIGQTLWLRVDSVTPRNGLLTLTLSSKGGGVASKPTSKL